MDNRYLSDLTNEQWAIIGPCWLRPRPKVDRALRISARSSGRSSTRIALSFRGDFLLHDLVQKGTAYYYFEHRHASKRRVHLWAEKKIAC